MGTDISWSPDGRILVSKGSFTTVVRDAATHRITGSWSSHVGTATAVAVDPSSRYVATAATDRTLQLWELREQRLVWNAVLVDADQVVVLNAAGEILWADPGAERSLVYFVERKSTPGVLERMTADEFRKLEKKS